MNLALLDVVVTSPPVSTLESLPAVGLMVVVMLLIGAVILLTIMGVGYIIYKAIIRRPNESDENDIDKGVD